MEPIVKSLFYNHHEVHTSNPESAEYRASFERLNRYYDRIQEAMGKSFYNDLYAAVTELFDLENLYFFQKGIQLGGQITLTALGSEPAC